MLDDTDDIDTVLKELIWENKFQLYIQSISYFLVVVNNKYII